MIRREESVCFPSKVPVSVYVIQKCNKMRENYIEQQLRLKVKKLGGLALKFVSPGFDSVPDRIVLLKGRVWFVEVKRPGKSPTPLQLICHDKLRRLGHAVVVINSIETLNDFIHELQSVQLSDI